MVAVLTQPKRELIHRLVCEGLEQRVIAARVGCSQSAVSNVVQAFKEAWQRKMGEAYEQRLGEAISRLREVEKRFWAKNDLAGVLQCISVELRMLGVLRGTKVEVVPSDLWTQVAQTLAVRAPDPVAQKLAAVEGNGHAEG